MKQRIIYLFILSFLTAGTAMAQGIKFGVKGGANITKIDGVPFSAEFKYGYHLGGYMEIKLSDKLSLQPELLWNQTQTQRSSNLNDIYKNLLNLNASSNITLNYLSVPILLNYKVANILSLQAGPQFGILIDQSKTVLANGQSAFKQGDFSMLAGAQLNLLGVNVYGRYAIGLNNVSDVAQPDNWKSQGFQVGLGFTF